MEGLLFAMKGLICMGSKGRRPVLHSRIEDTEALTACNPVNPVILQPKITLNRSKASACESIRWRRVARWAHLEAGKPSLGRQAFLRRAGSGCQSAFGGACGTAGSRALTFKGKK